MTSLDSTPRHPIRVVAQRTGLTTATIRAWERRYNAVSPGRSDGGQRLYSDAEVERLLTLRRLTDAGRSISMVASLSAEEARALLDEDRSAATRSPAPASEGRRSITVDRAFALVLDRDAGGLERTLWLAGASLGSRIFLDGIVAPLLQRIGDGWASGVLDTGQEHLASDVIDGVLARISEPSRGTEGRGVVVATLPGERHGLGARLVAAAAAAEGWRVTFLGTDLPVSDIAAMVRSVEADTVAISMVATTSLADATRELTNLRGLLDPSVQLLVGGGSAALLDPDRLPDGVTVHNSLDPFRRPNIREG